jgi:hypothetical protein
VVIGAAALLALFVRVPVWLVLLGGASAALLAGVLS